MNDVVDKTISISNLKNIDLQNCLFPNDPIRIPSRLSHVLLNYFFEHGACQPSPFDLPNKMFPKTKDSTGKLRSFHECYYFTNIPTKPTPIKRQWLSYSPTVDQIFCTTCKLFGLKKGKNRNLVDHGSNNWKHLKRTIENHESSTEHLQAEISCGIYTKNQRLDLTLLHSANQKIASNRELLRVIIDALLYSARQNIALRGHNEKKTSLNRGNFLELLSVLSNNHAGLKNHLEQINMSTKRQRVSFISNRSQNKLLNIMSESIRSQILKDVKDAGIFAVIIDTTTDIANYEQLTFVLRYVNNSGSIEERLVALETAADGTGQGLFKKFCSITEKYNLNWRQNLCAQSYDGAASMQGIYSGLRTLIQKENPNAIYVWCFAHLLNLVVVDTCDCCEVTKHFFGEIQALVSFFRARKRTATFIECQQQLYSGERTRRLKCFSDTRWTSHGRVITVLFERFGAILETLKRLVNDNDRVTSSGAKSLLTVITFEFILTMILSKNIFAITTPLSNYLQSKSIDFIQALNMIDASKEKLTSMRCDAEFELIVNEAKHFAEKHNMSELSFKETRPRKKKRMPGENMFDEVSVSACDRYRTNTYFKVLDQIISSINSRFSGAREILKDLSLLSPERLMNMTKDNKSIPEDSFHNVSNWLKDINGNDLKREYIMFSHSLRDLVSGLETPLLLHKPDSPDDTYDTDSTDSSDNTNTDDENNTDLANPETKITINTILNVLSNYNLMSAFPNLYLAYKALGTIPATSASAERTFSKVYF